MRQRPTKGELLGLYWRNEDGGMSIQQIAAQFSVNPSSVANWLHSYGIPLRDKGRRRKLPGKQEMFRLYVLAGMSSSEIAQMFDCSDHKPVLTMLHKYGIPVRRSGPKIVDTCIEPGCARPVHRIRHNKNGALYGRRCLHHKRIHYARLNRQGMRIRRNIPPEKWRYQSEA